MDNHLKDTVDSILGGETFREKVIKYLKEIPDKIEISEFKRIEHKHKMEDVVSAIAKYYGISEDN